MRTPHLRWITWLVTLVTLMSMALLAASPVGATSATAVRAADTPPVSPPQAHPHGKSYGDWAARWWQWAFSFPLAEYPPAQLGAVDCSQGQSGSVWFLAGTSGSVVTRSCTIPTGTALFFPVLNYINDYPCPDPAFQPAPGQSLEEFLTAGAMAVIDNVTDLEVVVDGQPVRDPFAYRATSPLFTFTADPSLVAIDSCVTGTPQVGVTDGYWIMVNPLPVGQHTIAFQGTADFGGGNTFDTQVTYHVTVVPGRH